MRKSIRVGDIEIYYEQHGEGETVVLLHGIGADRLTWMLQVRDLRESFKVITPDNRDSARSSRSDREYEIGQLAHDTIGLLDELDLKRVHLVGASFGGAIAQHIALAEPERIATLSLLATFCKCDNYIRASTVAWMELYSQLPRADVVRAWFPLVYSRKFRLEHPDQIERLMEFTINNPDAADGKAVVRQSEALLSHDLCDDLAKIKVPTLVLCGEADTLTPVECSREIASRIKGAKLITYPETGHALFLERAAEINRDLKEFFHANKLFHANPVTTQ